MKYLVVFVAVLAFSSAQYKPFKSPFGSSFASQPRRAAPRPQPLRAAASSVSVARVSAGSDANAETVRYDNDVSPDGSYSFSYETNNGISAQEQGSVSNLGGNPPQSSLTAQGSYSYTAPDGQPISLSYIADENGYRPQSDILPVGPPIPPQIARSLEWIARNPQKQK